MKDQKETNPKDRIGSSKLPMDLIPATASIEESLAFLEGCEKYGAFNYRVVGVRASIYIAAAKRHLDKWVNGEERDPKTDIHHLGSARACLGILLDAQSMGKLTDDRPPENPWFSQTVDEAQERVKHIKELFKDKHPRHYSITDGPNGAPGAEEGPLGKDDSSGPTWDQPEEMYKAIMGMTFPPCVDFAAYNETFLGILERRDAELERICLGETEKPAPEPYMSLGVKDLVDDAIHAWKRKRPDGSRDPTGLLLGVEAWLALRDACSIGPYQELGYYHGMTVGFRVHANPWRIEVTGREETK